MSDGSAGKVLDEIEAVGTVHDDVERAWSKERPDLDLTAACVLMRLEQVNHFHELRVQRVSRAMGLSTGDLRVLLALRRSGKPFESRPTDLFRALYVSSGAISRRTANLQALGYILRVAANDDGRSELVRLTRKGVQATDRAISQIADQTNLFRRESGLSDEELAAFDLALRRILEFENGRERRGRRQRSRSDE